MKEEFESLTKFMKKGPGDITENVIVSAWLADSPYLDHLGVGWSAYLECIMKALAVRVYS